MATLAVWMALDISAHGKPTAVGAATAIVVGLVVITPAAGLSADSAIVMGAIGASPAITPSSPRAHRLDDSLESSPRHGVGGLTGALLTGVFAETA